MADERNGSHVHGADRVANSSVFAGMSGEDKALLGELIANVEFSRQELMKSMTDRRRDVDDECGYPKGEASAHDYQALYDYFSIAARVVELLPKECWQVQPTVYELENAEEKTPFEKAWDQLGRGLRGGEHSHYRTEKGSPVWEYLKRLDVLSGVGRYGVLLLGLDDGLPLNLPPRGFDEQQTYPAGPQLGQDGTPVKGPDGQVVVAGSPWRGDGRGGNYTVNAEYAGTQTLKLNYLKVFPEKLAPVIRWETNPLSPRHGQPCYYSVTFHDPDTHWGASLGTPLGTAEVHWARVLHVADTSGQASSSDVFAPSRMRVVRRHLFDLIKMYGGDAEGFWLACVNYISFETNPQLGGSVKINKPAVRDMWERVKNGLDRAFMLEGLSARSVAPTPVDPTPHVDKAIEAICIILGCPVRVFKGSERGELASSQDDQAWNDRLRARQRDYVTPRIIVPFVDRLILLGVLPRPDAPQPPPETAAKLQAKKPADPAASPPGTGPDEATDATGNPPKPGEKTPTKGKPPAGKKPFPPQPSANTLVDNLEVGEEEDDEDAVEIPTGEYADPDEPASEDEADALDPETEAAPMGYTVDWPDLTSQSDAEEAAVAAQWTTALATYIEKNLQTLITPLDYLVTICGFDETEARQFLENTRELGEVQAQMDAEAEAQAMAKQAEMIEAGLAPDPTQPPPPGTPPVGSGPPQPGASPFPPKPEKPKGPGAVLANTDPTANADREYVRDKEGQFAKTPGTGGDLPGLADAPKEARKRHPREQVILDAAKDIPVTDENVSGDKVDRPRWSEDFDRVEELMTEAEREVMAETLETYKQNYIDGSMDDFEPDDPDPDDFDREAAAKDMGWADKDVRDKALRFADESWDDDRKTEYAEAVEEWYSNTSLSGPDAVDELKSHLSDHGGFDDQADQVGELESEARDDVEKVYEEWVEDQRKEQDDSYRESLEESYDPDDDRREYLKQFYDDNEDDLRFQGIQVLGKWGKDADGDPAYHFETSAGNRYEVWTSPEKAIPGSGEKIIQVGFKDAKGSHAVTGAGGAAEVFGTVSAAVVALAQKSDVPAMYFTAAEESRQKLYDRLVRTVTKVLPDYAAVAVEKPGGGKAYYVAKRPLIQVVKDEAAKKGYAPEVLVNRRAPTNVTPEFDPMWLTPRAWPGGLTLNRTSGHGYDPDQPRDPGGEGGGQWTKGGAGGGSGDAAGESGSADKGTVPAGGKKAKAAAKTVHFHGNESPGDGWTDVGTDSSGKKVWAPPGTKAGFIGKLVGKKDTNPAADAGEATPATMQARMDASPEYRNQQAEFDKQHDHYYADTAAKTGKTPQQVKAQCAAEAQAFADSHDVYMRCPADALPKILASGRAKTQHETGSSRGDFNPQMRKDVEARGQGVPPDAPDAVRPLSAYLGKKDFAGSAGENANGPDDPKVGGYGEVIIKPKAHVRDRSTVTFDDSASQATLGTGQATPLGAVGHRSVSPKAYNGSPGMLKDDAAFHKEKAYAEVQVHGGLTVDDIEEVGFPSEPAPAIRAQLEQRGIKVRVYGKAGQATANYDPGQARDDDGRWASGRGRTPADVAGVGAKLKADRKLSADPPSAAETLKGVATYTDTEHFAAINASMRKGKALKSIPPPELQAMQTMAGQPLPAGVVVYHGVSDAVFDKVYGKLTPGQGVKIKGFLSTTISPKVAGDYGKTLLEIRAKTGLYVADKSKFPFEEEVVKAHGTTYRFDGIEESVDFAGRKHRVVKLTEV